MGQERVTTPGDQECSSSEENLYFEDEADISPNFQRVSISGEDTSGVPLEDLEQASKLLIQALDLREHYMYQSKQSFPSTTSRFLKSVHERNRFGPIEHEDRKTIAGE